MANLDSGIEWFKPFAVAVPLLASSLAVSYDVGFFFGIGIGFFTFFSLTEHIVFALQAIPFALVPALTIVGILGSTWWGLVWVKRSGEEAAKKAQSMTPEERETRLVAMRKKVRRNNLIDPIVQITLFGFAVYMFTLHQYTAAFLILVSQIVAKIAYPIKRWESKEFRYGFAVFCIVCGLVTAFAFGYDRSGAILSAKAPSSRIAIEGHEIPATLVRGGDRGVLFKSFETGKVSFLRWDKILKIDGQ